MFEIMISLAVAAPILAAGLFLWRRSIRRRQLRVHSISPKMLHSLITGGTAVTILDVRLPLDLLAHSETIPGAEWIAPHEIIADPSALSKNNDYVLYCTCPGEESSQKVLKTALGMGFLRVKVLKGGIEGWKREGYTTVPYVNPFHLGG